MIVLGYFIALLIGALIGALGGGGSLLAVPAFVYLFGLSAIESTSYSLFVVGVTATFAFFKHVKSKNIEFKSSITFTIASFMATYATRRFIMPSLPDDIFLLPSFSVNKDSLILIVFSIVMVLSSLSVLRKTKAEEVKVQAGTLKLVLMGLAVGLISGFVGAGGGFLIVPALMIGLRLPIKKAIATSVWIIMVNSTFGFLGSISSLEPDWIFLFGFSAISLVGLAFGFYVQKFLPDQKLKRVFAGFVLLMGVFILMKQWI
jgi:uncharacterized membrane protein YfcA